MKISRSLSSISLYTESVGACGTVLTIGIPKALEEEGTIQSTGVEASGGCVSGTGGEAIGRLSSIADVCLGFERAVDLDLRLLEVTGAIGSIGLGGGRRSSVLGSSGTAMSGRAGLPGTGVDEAVVEGVTFSEIGFGASVTSFELAGINSNSRDTFGLPFSRY